MDNNKKQALTAALSQIEKQFGKGAIMRMGDGSAQRNVDVVSSGSLAIDVALGIGGLPRGRVVEIYGPESSGKTTLTLQVIAEAQKLGGTAAFVQAGNIDVYVHTAGVSDGDSFAFQYVFYAADDYHLSQKIPGYKNPAE